MAQRLRRIPAAGLLLAAVVSGIAFVVVTLLYKAGALRPLDAVVTPAIRTNRDELLDYLGAVDERVFSSAAALAIVLVFAAVLWLRGPRWSWIAPMFLGVSAFVDLASRQGFAVFLHPRQLAQSIELLLRGGHVSGLGAFPSGHVERAVFLAVLFVGLLPRPIGVPLALLAFTTIFSRIYTQAHRPSEALGGLALGICVGAFALWCVELLRASPLLERARFVRGLA
jgi:membrane-associated phospholipid phosphatase